MRVASEILAGRGWDGVMNFFISAIIVFCCGLTSICLLLIFSFHFTIYHGTMTFCYDRHTLLALRCAAPPAAAALTLSHFDVLYLGYPSENLMCLHFFFFFFATLIKHMSHSIHTMHDQRRKFEDSESEVYL